MWLRKDPFLCTIWLINRDLCSPCARGGKVQVVGLFGPQVGPASTRDIHRGMGRWHLLFPLPQPRDVSHHLAGNQSKIKDKIVTLPRAQKIHPPPPSSPETWSQMEQASNCNPAQHKLSNRTWGVHLGAVGQPSRQANALAGLQAERSVPHRVKPLRSDVQLCFAAYCWKERPGLNLRCNMTVPLAVDFFYSLRS